MFCPPAYRPRTRRAPRSPWCGTRPNSTPASWPGPAATNPTPREAKPNLAIGVRRPKRCHDALKLGLETPVASGRLGAHRGHPVTVIVTTTLAELDRAAHAVVDSTVPMPAPPATGGGSRLPMPDLIRMAAKGIH
jgi:hypothetical protein